jgi:hypothetical protein
MGWARRGRQAVASYLPTHHTIGMPTHSRQSDESHPIHLLTHSRQIGKSHMHPHASTYLGRAMP